MLPAPLPLVPPDGDGHALARLEYAEGGWLVRCACGWAPGARPLRVSADGAAQAHGLHRLTAARGVERSPQIKRLRANTIVVLSAVGLVAPS